MVLNAAGIAFIVVFSVQFVIAAALVAYLLYRPRKKDGKPKLRPDGRVSIRYDGINPENGGFYPQKIQEDREPHSTPSSSASDISKKPISSDSVAIEMDPTPVYAKVNRKVVPHDKEAEPQEPKETSFTTENETLPKKKLTDEEEKDKLKNKKLSSSSSSENENARDDARLMKDTSKSSTSSDSDEKDKNIYAKVDKDKKKKRPVPKKRSYTVTDSVQNESRSSFSDEDFRRISKSRRKARASMTSSSSGDERIINHKKKTHHKRYIHNIEEEVIVEEHTYNKKRKKIYRKVPGSDEFILVSTDDDDEESQKSPKVFVTRKVKRRSKKSRSSSESSSSDEGMTSPTYHTEYRFDVSKKVDDDHVTKTYVETDLSPTRQKTKHRTYKESITEHKRKDIEMQSRSSSSSSSDSDTKSGTMRSERSISISSTPKFKPFVAMVSVEKQKKDYKMKESSSSSESDEEEKNMRTEKKILVSSTPKFKPFSATVSMREDKESSSSSSSESDSETRIRSATNITLESTTHEITPVTEVFTKRTPVIESSSSSSQSDVATRKSSSAMIRLKSPPRRRASTSSTSSLSSDEKAVTLHYSQDRPYSLSDGESSHSSSRKRSRSSRLKTRQHTTEETFLPRTVVTTEETIITTTKTKTKKPRKDIRFTSGWKREVSLEDLFKAGVVSETTIEQLEQGTIEQEEVAKAIHVYLVGEEPIAGLLMSDSGEKVSIYDAWKRGLIRRGTSISLLEAQAATGRIVDPKTAEKMSVNEAAQKRLIDRQFEAVLTRAERAVYGYKTRLSNETLSLFEAMKRGLVVENHGIRLLEAQIATGGIIDPNANHRLPVEIAYDRGLFDKRLHDILEDPSDDTRGFFDPNTEENLTYMELMERCVVDKDSGIRLLPFRSHRDKMQAKTSKVVFQSANKRQVYLQDVIDAELVDLKTARKFDSGQMTSEEVHNMVAHLKVYVDGTMPIAGVINSQTGEKMSMIEAYRSGLLRKGTAFELLEAQAACGKIMDVQTTKPVSLETAVRIGVIDSEFEDCVSRANRAVTGYREPFKREVLSLCEAMARHLVVQRHAIRLLEAQIATGGIIEVKSPVRISISVAVKRGLLDHQLALKLQKKTTASYFDPVTGENLNYSELMGRCVLDKDSNLLFLMVEGGTVTQNIRPFEPEPESMKIREKSQAMLTTEVVETTMKSRSSSTLERSRSPPREMIPSSSPAILNRKVVIVDPNTGKELTVQEALESKLIDEDTARQLQAQEGDFQDDV